MMAVYLIHFDPPYKHAKHYLGFAEDVLPRVWAHQTGHGARLTQVAVDHGCNLVLARVWEDGDRKLERKLKRRKNAPKLCPICGAELSALDFTIDDVDPLEF